MPEYTVGAVLASVAVVVLELTVLHTRLFRSRTYWVTMAIVFSFQCLVDGWLTKLDSPIVLYHPEAVTGIRFPWDVPIEDFLFGFVLVTFVLLRWQAGAGPPGDDRSAGAAVTDRTATPAGSNRPRAMQP